MLTFAPCQGPGNRSYNSRYRTCCPGAIMALQHPPAPVSQTPAHGFLPKVATGLTDQDRRRIEDALDHSVSANTRTMYASAWNSFDEWTRARGVPSLPAPPELVAAYLLELPENSRPLGRWEQHSIQCLPAVIGPGPACRFARPTPRCPASIWPPAFPGCHKWRSGC